MIPAGTKAEVSCRIRMGKTSAVTAVVETAAGLFSASKEVKVTIGGCGG
jgi:sulfur-oxidizing protein SoxY